MKTANIKSTLNSLQLSDIYSLMLFIMYKVQDIPEYAVVSELCYLLDGSNLTRLMTYFAGKTITIPTEEEFAIVTSALLMYQYINIDGESYANAQAKLNDLTAKQKDKASELYLKILPIMRQYNIDRSQIQKNARH
jgi:hypothetical protein